MENSNIRTFLRGKKKLSVNILNKELLDSKVFNDRNQWDISIIQNGIFIDLSQCEWVDFIAISQLVLIVESALKFNIDVKIALPYPSLTDSQINKIEITQDEILLATFNKNADKRKKVLIYLDILGFKKVILCSHIHSGSIQIIENFQFVSPLKVKKIDKDFLNRFKANTSIDQKIYFNRIKSKCIIPLQWVSFSIKENHYTKILEQLKSVLSNNEKGIEEIDADTFSKIILYELVKNVHDHSKSAYGLVGIVTQNVKAITSDSYYNSESKFYEFFEKTYANYISIFFGDTGVGLLNSDLDLAFTSKFNDIFATPSTILKWAFDRWSTRKIDERTNVTKGLYRINRIVQKYNGLFTLRTDKIYGGFQRGGAHRAKWFCEDKIKLSFIPGTMAQIHLSPQKEVLKTNIVVVEDEEIHWEILNVRINQIDPIVTFEYNIDLQKIFSQNDSNYFILLSIENNFSNLEDEKLAIENHLLYLSLSRHPNFLLIYLLYDSAYIENCIDSVNQHIQKELSDPNSDLEIMDNVYDPILVVTWKYGGKWVGGDLKVLKFLNILYEKRNKEILIEDLPEYTKLTEEEKKKIIKYLRVEGSIITTIGNNTIKLNILDFQNKVREIITKFLLNRKTDISKNYFVTPNTKLVRDWIPIERITREHNEIISLTFGLLLQDLKIIDAENIDDYYLLIDNLLSFDIALNLARWLNLKRSNLINLNNEIDGKFPKINKIFDSKDKIIVVTSLISSYETINRALKTIFRDLSTPLIVLNIVNLVKDEPINIWDEDKGIPVISIIDQFDIEITAEEILKYRLNPIYKRPQSFENEEFKFEDNFLENERLYNFIIEKKGLHFTHVGKANNRHFTFYLNPERLLYNPCEKTDEIIFSPYNKRIETWLTTNNITEFEIWIPKTEFPLNSIAEKIIEYFRNRIPIGIVEVIKFNIHGDSFYKLKHSSSSKRSSNIVIIEWGSLTGSTIQSLIQQSIQLEKVNVLVSVLFSQMNDDEKEFFESISKIKIGYPKQKSLFPDINNVILPDINIEIEFFYKLPIKGFNPIDCPVCEHINSMEEFGIKGAFMDDFYRKRVKRLNIRDKEITKYVPKDFYFDNFESYDFELNSNLIFEMFKFRSLLEKALKSTYYRLEVLNYLKEIDNKADFLEKNIDSKLFGVIYFLSVEIMWVQRPPLYFKVFRKLLAKISLRIATKNYCDFIDENKIKVNVKLVTRFKYAAISLLRSSDKGMFLENIIQMFESSYFDNHFSDSLTQNILFHIHSYLRRPYHNSKLYLEVIFNAIKHIDSNRGYQLETKLRHVLIYISYYVSQKKDKVPLYNLSQIELFKKHKELVDKYYSDHDWFGPYNLLFPYTWEAIIGEDWEYLDNETKEDYLHWAKITVTDSWRTIADRLNSTLYFYSHMKFMNSSLINNDIHFGAFVRDRLNDDALFGNNDKLSRLIWTLRSNPEILWKDISFYNLYVESLVSYKKWFISSKLEKYESNVVNIANSIPTELTTTIDDYFFSYLYDDKFKNGNKVSIVPKLDYDPGVKIFIFFPKNILIDFFEQISRNLYKHYDKNKDSGIVIIVRILPDPSSLDFIWLNIENTGTMGKEGEFGGLGRICSEFYLFDAEEEDYYDIKDDKFVIKCKFRLWN